MCLYTDSASVREAFWFVDFYMNSYIYERLTVAALAHQPNDIHSSIQSSSCFKLSTDVDEAPLIIRMQPLASAVYYSRAPLVHNCGISDFFLWH